MFIQLCSRPDLENYNWIQSRWDPPRVQDKTQSQLKRRFTSGFNIRCTLDSVCSNLLMCHMLNKWVRSVGWQDPAVCVHKNRWGGDSFTFSGAAFKINMASSYNCSHTTGGLGFWQLKGYAPLSQMLHLNGNGGLNQSLLFSYANWFFWAIPARFSNCSTHQATSGFYQSKVCCAWSGRDRKWKTGFNGPGRGEGN